MKSRGKLKGKKMDRLSNGRNVHTRNSDEAKGFVSIFSLNLESVTKVDIKAEFHKIRHLSISRFARIEPL